MNKDIMVTKAVLPSLEEYVDEIKDIWESHWLTNMGEKHIELEKQLKDYLHVENISLFCNGHMALELLLQALDLHGEVITTPFTFASTTHAIVRNGLTPVFCDITKDDYTIDTDKIEGLITEKTSAILPVHVYGNICNVEKIQQIAEKYNLKVVYDAAHAFGVKYQNRGIGNFGDASMFSFHATKVYNTIEGGGVCFADSKLGEKLYQLKNFGIKNQEEVDGIGANAKMNEFQAAMGICNLRHIEESINRRKELTELYRNRLVDLKGIKLVEPQKDVVSNYAYMPIYINEEEFGMNRNELEELLRMNNVYTRKYFYPLTNDFSCYKEWGFKGETPVAQKVSNRILTLPLYDSLLSEDVLRICDIITKKN